jgi:membrane protein implicated in regulation of membrane protease activity
MGGVVPLSEHEQRQLEQIEQALYREDRRLVRLVRSSDPHVHYRRRVITALIGLILGAAMVAAGIVLPHLFGLAVGGFVVVLLSGVWALSSWRQMATVTLGGAAAVPVGKRRSGRSRHRGKGAKGGRGQSARATMMERLDERWRRRQEGGGR